MTLAGPRLARAVLPALMCLPAAAQTPAGTGDAEAAVRATFEAYRQALMAGDGELAASLVDRETGEYYRQLKRLVLEGSEEEVRQRTFVDRFLVVAFRHQFASDELAAMELADVIVRAMDLGWINSDGDRAARDRRHPYRGKWPDRGKRPDGRKRGRGRGANPGVARGPLPRRRDG